MGFKPTPQHEAFFNWIQEKRPTKTAAILEAVAGSGKTTTIREGCKFIPSSDNALFLAFNKSAVEEVISRGLPNNVTALTLNSLGHRAILRRFGQVKLDTKKTRALLDANLSPADSKLYGNVVNTLVAKAKAFGLVTDRRLRSLMVDTDESWWAIVDRFDIDPPENYNFNWDRAFNIARSCLKDSVNNTKLIDFDDQLYITVAHEVEMPKFKWVMVDEAQDLNPVQRRMLHGCLAEGGRLIAVGDPNQAIYGFRGADSESLASIAREFDAIPFPLSITYRCPKSVVAMAKKYVPHLEAAETAPEGEVLTLERDKVQWSQDDLIICRKNAPLIKMAYELFAKRIPCTVIGRDIGQGLQAIIKKLKPNDVADLLAKLERYETAEREKLSARKADDSKFEALADKCEALRVFADEVDTIDALSEAINKMFSDDAGDKLRLSTVHRAKGGEADRVFVLDPHLMPSKAARQPWQVQQEHNLIYVAYTRARKTMVFINSPGDGAKKKKD